MDILFITETDVKEFISDRNLNLVESKRLLKKIALVRLFYYLDKCVFKQLNRDQVINPYLKEEIDAVNDFVKPIILTLLELEHINFNSISISNVGNKQRNTEFSTTSTIEDARELKDLLYKDLDGLKNELHIFLCENKAVFPCYADKCTACGCEGSEGYTERKDFY